MTRAKVDFMKRACGGLAGGQGKSMGIRLNLRRRACHLLPELADPAGDCSQIQKTRQGLVSGIRPRLHRAETEKGPSARRARNPLRGLYPRVTS
jgi:hypothetical protein